METLKKYLEETNKKKFLDIGTGSGPFIHFLTSIYDGYDEFVGIDLHEKAIEAAEKNNKNERIKYLKMDAQKIDFEDESFDVVCISNSLHHLEQPVIVLREMARVLKKDGFILMKEMINEGLDENQKSHMFLHHLAAKIDRYNGDFHDVTYGRSKLKDILTRDGLFEIELAFDLEVERVTSNTEEELEYMYNILKRVTSRTPAEHVDEIEKEAEQLKKHIEKYGYDGATSLVVILKKK